MLNRHVAHYGSAPERAAFDGGYASKSNLADAKSLGVLDVAFHKKRGLKASEMTRASWIYAQLRRFRAGIEAGTSYLKRCFGLARCNWRGLTHPSGLRPLSRVRSQPAPHRSPAARVDLNRAPLSFTLRCRSTGGEPVPPDRFPPQRTQEAPRITTEGPSRPAHSRRSSLPSQVTGLSRAQVQRLIQQYQETGRIVDCQGPLANAFKARFTEPDIGLLAEADAGLGQMCGHARRAMMRSMYE